MKTKKVVVIDSEIMAKLTEIKYRENFSSAKEVIEYLLEKEKGDLTPK